MSGKKIGIMGGTFNPIHNGHLLIAENARWQFGLDQICFLPAGIPPHKQNLMVLDGHSRCEMVQLAIEDNPDFYLSDYEVQRTEPSYTYLTLEYLKQKYPEDTLYFIMGADSLRDFAGQSWTVDPVYGTGKGKSLYIRASILYNARGYRNLGGTYGW